MVSKNSLMLQLRVLKDFRLQRVGNMIAKRSSISANRVPSCVTWPTNLANKLMN